MKTIRKINILSIVALTLFILVLIPINVNASNSYSNFGATYTVKEVTDERDLGYGVKFHRELSTLTTNITGISTGVSVGVAAAQQVSILEVAPSADVQLVPYAFLESANWVASTVKKAAAQYEFTNPGYRVIAAVNGDFFRINDSVKASTGVTIGQGEFYKSVSNHGAVNTLAIKNSGEGKQLFTTKTNKTVPVLSIYDNDGKVFKKVKIDVVNGEPGENQIALYYATRETSFGNVLNPVTASNVYFVKRGNYAVTALKNSFYGVGTISEFKTEPVEIIGGQFAVKCNNAEINELLKENVKIRCQYEYDDPALEGVENFIGFPYQIITDSEPWKEVQTNVDNAMYRHPRTIIGQKANGEVEQISVGVGMNASYTTNKLTAMNGENIMGRSYASGDFYYTYKYHNQTITVGDNISGNTAKSSDTSFYGRNFQQQWDYALSKDPEVVFVTGWNEWIALRFQNWEGTTNAFPDQFNDEYSRDIEPSKGKLKDYYYYQLVDNVRKYKGTSTQKSQDTPITINKLSDWDNSNINSYNHYTGGKTRNIRGFGTTNPATYVNNTFRNDIKQAKVSYDKSYIYFYVQTANNLTSSTSSKWMRLLIDTKDSINSPSTENWEEFEYIVNRNNAGTKTMTLEKSTGGWNFNTIGTVEYSVSNNVLQLKIPRSYLGLTNRDITFNFKWCDNNLDNGDIMTVYTNGDSAPGGRFAFHFSGNTEYKEITPEPPEDDNDTPNTDTDNETNDTPNDNDKPNNNNDNETNTETPDTDKDEESSNTEDKENNNIKEETKPEIQEPTEELKSSPGTKPFHIILVIGIMIISLVTFIFVSKKTTIFQKKI